MPEPRWLPHDAQYADRVRDNFARQQFMATLGAELTAVAPGDVVIELPLREALTQQHGYAHAGVVASIIDSACGYAAYTLMPADANVVSVEFKVQLLAPAVGDRLVARGRVVRAGRSLTVCQGDVHARSSAGERHVALMTATMMTQRDTSATP